MRLLYIKPELKDLSQRARIAFVYKMKLDDMNHQDKKIETSATKLPKSPSREIIDK